MSERQLDRIQTALDKTGVWIDPASADLLTPKQVRKIETSLADADDPIFLVVQQLDESDDFGGEAEELLTQLHDRSGVDGLYLAPTLYEGSDGPHGYMTERLWGPGPDTWQADAVAHDRHIGGDSVVDDPGAWVTDYVTLLADGTAAEAYERESAEDIGGSESSESSSGTSTPSAPTPDGDFPVIGVASVSAVVLLLVAGAVLFVRERRRNAPFALPRSVVSQVRDAHDAELTAQARREVLALGEAIDASEIPAGDTSSAWQQTLDHYSASTRALDRAGEDDVLDVVGAIVLARNGQDALAAAQAGRSFTPAVPCFLNPLHTGTTTAHRVQSSGMSGRTKVPLCGQCRADLAAGRSPDTLDVIRLGQPVHYFESGIEPWASTGYGAISPLLPVLS